MILGFKQEINSKPTYFAEKIWSMLITNNLSSKDEFYYYSNNMKLISDYSIHKPKLHTIRKDESDRWHKGCLIHPVYNHRQKNQFQFTSTFKCLGTQKIEIKYHLQEELDYQPIIYIDGIEYHETEQLAINDGFDCINDFFAWFNTDFTGKIIHFTNLKY